MNRGARVSGNREEAGEMRSHRRRWRAAMCGGGDDDREIEQQFSRDGSHYSLSTGILPSLGARSNRTIKLARFVVCPYDRRYRLKRRSPTRKTITGPRVFRSLDSCKTDLQPVARRRVSDAQIN